MDEEPRWWDGGDPTALDRQVYETRTERMLDHAREVIRTTGVDHVLFVVAQYWNDQADDEVHVESLV
ncbi:MAG: hypothetical protein AAF602_01535, partial [Myxococcota bacterium]